MTLNRVATLLIFVLALGCGRAATSVRPPVSRTPARAVEPSQPSTELPLAGASARFPAPATHFRRVQNKGDGTVITVGASATSDGQAYLLAHVIRERGPRSSKMDAKTFAYAWIAKVHGERPTSLAGFSGFDVAGTTQQGKAARLRIYEVGQGIVMATVVREDGALDETTVRAFFDSMTIRTTWSLQAFPEGRFTALLPDGGIEYGPEELEAENYLIAYGTSLGNAEDQMFAVYALPLEGEGVDPNHRLDAAAKEFLESSKLIWQELVLYENARSRDYLLQTEEGFQRVRLIITETHLYMLLASARSSAPLLDEEVKRFFRSLTWYPER